MAKRKQPQSYTVFFTGSDDMRKGYISGVFGTRQDADEIAASLMIDRIAFVSWVEERDPTPEEMARDEYLRGPMNEEDDARRNARHYQHIIERTLDKLQHLSLTLDEATGVDQTRALLAADLADATRDYALATRNIAREVRTRIKKGNGGENGLRVHAAESGKR